ncbi:vascular cell adhesion protein 1-like [Clarias gariepinus]|uniref:hemicentin-1-like n=1 Tax=Clarias gariepinus TaxID=13013 RepID=UPI00234D345E|nr:hemicentin-1-like [Clarias gariepinus]
MQKGEAVSLSCTAGGNPEPEVTWRFQSQIKATGRRQTTLTISEATFADDGVYTCTAMNDLGYDRRTVTVHVEGDCPVKILPVKLVREFGASASANCSTTIIHHGMGWEASQGAVDMVENVQLITWRVDNLTHYDIKPYCFMNMKTQCSNNLPVIVYKRPDWVSISTVDHTGPMTEGGQYELRCDVQNVAPVRLLTVNWYKGHHLVKRESVSGEDKFPVNVNVTLQISPSKDDDGVQYRCVAELNLGPEGPQHPPIVTSDPLNITVHYKPEINCLDWSPIINTPLSSYPYNVVGNPTPHITWHRDELLISSDMILSKNDSGRYIFFASNLMGNASCNISITVEFTMLIRQSPMNQHDQK